MPTLNNNINPTPETPRPFEPLKQQSELQVNSYIYEDLKNKAQISLLPSEQYEKETSSLNSIYNIGKDNRVQTKVADIGIENYQRLSSGEFTPLYKNIIVGTNNEDRLARQQTTGEKWANGWAKFGTGTLNTIAGATVGAVYGIGSWISEGNFQAMYDNDFTKYLDDMNTKMRYKLPNYYTEQERNTSFDVTSANFWADKVLGAAAFTVGAIVSEGIWAAATGGALLTTTAARWAGRMGKAGKWSKAILGEKAVKAASGSYKSWLKAPLFNAYKKTGMLNKDAAIRAAKTAEALNTTRFLATSSGYEAGVEALHYKKEAEENFYRNFYELNGRQPNGQEIADFTEDLENSANVVFGGNMALLSVSNAVMFGSLFNIKNPFRQTTKGINRKLFGIGIEETVKDGKKVFQAITPTKGQKLFTSAYGITKPLATEGLFEEGGQGALSGAAGYWTESGYNPKYNGHSVSMMDAMAHGMAEQYGTKEGWEEIGIGFIIGGGASIIQGKGKPLDIKQIQEARKNQENIVKGLNTFGQDVLVKRMIMSNKIQSAVDKELKATKQGNYVESEIANQDKLLTEIEFMHGIGEDVDQLPEKYRIAMSNMTEDQFKEAGIENPQEYIETVINAYSNVVKRYKKNIRYAEAMYGVDVQKDNHDLAIQAQALAYTITTGETASTIMEETLDEIGSEIGSENQRVLTLESELQRLTKNQRSTLSRNVTKLKAQKEKQAKLVQKIQEVQNAPKETEGDRQSGAELAKLNKALLETNNEIQTLESEVNRFKEELSQERTRRRGMEANSEFENLSELELISLEDLLNIDEKLNNINDLINSYEGYNPQLYSKLTALVGRYNQAKESFVRYNAMGVALSSGKVNVRPKKVGGALGKLFDKKKYTQDEFTQAFLDDTVAAHMVSRARGENEVEVEENVNLNELFIPITDERITTISEKIRNNQPLSKRERQLYEANQEAIEKRTEEINKEKGDNPRQQKIKIDIQSQIDEINKRRQEELNKRKGNTISQSEIQREFLDRRDNSQEWWYFNQKAEEVGRGRITKESNPELYKELVEAGVVPFKDGISRSEVFEAQSKIENQIKKEVNKEVKEKGLKRITDEFRFQDDYKKIKEINAKYDAEIEAVKKQKTTSATQSPQSEVDQLKQRLESTMKEDYYPLQYVGEDYDEMVKNKPSEEDVNRYRELVNKDRLAEEEFEFEELQQKLSNWRVLDSAVSGTQSLADIINLIQQLETQVEQNETVTEITEEFDTQIIDDNLGSGTMVVYELTQNTTGNATAKILKNNRIKLSHIKINTILERLGGTNEKKTSKGTTVYNITPENTEGSIEITVTPNGAIEMNLDDFLSLQQSLNLYVVDSGQINWTYKDIYEVVGDEFVEKPSDFIDDDISGNIYELQKEDEVEFYYDSEDAWNQELYKKYKKGKITKEEFRNQVKVYIRKDGKNYGTLKSMREESLDESMASIRDNTAEVALNEQSTLVGKTTVSQIMLGSPKFALNENNQPTELEITDRGIEEVVTTGYILDNEFTLSDKTLEEKTDQSFVGKISKNQEGKKIPVVVIKKGKHFIAYPISVIKKGNSQASRFEAIMNNEFSDDNGKVREINELLISLGIAPSTYNLIDLSEQEKLNKIQEDLSNYKVYTTADDFANKYDKKLLKYDATIKIDLEDLNRSISSPKVRIDLDNITIYQTSELKYESMAELEDILSDLSLEVDRIIMNDYVDNKGDAIENKFTDVYADDSVIKNPENQLDKMHNVRMLMKGYPLMSNKFKQLLGQDKVKTIEKAIKKIEFLRKQIDTKANTEVQSKKNELKC